jgi:hypothetical protein
VHNINFTQLSEQPSQSPIISLPSITLDECKKKIWHFISIRNWKIGITSILRSYQTGHPANQLSVIFAAMCKVGNKLSTGKAVSSPECSLQTATNGLKHFMKKYYNIFCFFPPEGTQEKYMQLNLEYTVFQMFTQFYLFLL